MWGGGQPLATIPPTSMQNAPSLRASMAIPGPVHAGPPTCGALALLAPAAAASAISPSPSLPAKLFWTAAETAAPPLNVIAPTLDELSAKPMASPLLPPLLTAESLLPTAIPIPSPLDAACTDEPSPDDAT